MDLLNYAIQLSIHHLVKIPYVWCFDCSGLDDNFVQFELTLVTLPIVVIGLPISPCYRFSKCNHWVSLDNCVNHYILFQQKALSELSEKQLIVI
ncbi:unnamed protein product [Heterobilharzia americana]|nr:unnamed protein product [Heterobilharzia americana]CAH8663589.1 unnamed protein product [Heterobilharzia americana]